MEDSRPKSKSKGESDGADEKMLQDQDLPINSVKMIIEKQNGDAKLDIGDLKGGYIGMGKEELLKYANDPFWVRLRWFLFVTFWLLWAAMLVGAIVIIYMAPKCDPPPPKTWWEQGPLAEVQDSNVSEDDIKALKQIKIQGLIVPWPEDTYAVFNDSHDFVKLLKNGNKHDINIIVELEPGTSEAWFNASSAKDEDFKDYYIWKKPKTDKTGKSLPPNNWLNKLNQSSWIFSDERNEYYYAPDGAPQLNFRTQAVVNEFTRVIGRFVDHGAKGIRLRGVPHLLADDKFEDELPSQNNYGTVHTAYAFYMHTKTEELSDLGPLLNEWRQVVKSKTESGPFMVANKLSKISPYTVNDSLVVDLPVEDVFTKPEFNVSDVVHRIKHIFEDEKITWPLWIKHNSSAELQDVQDIISLLLPGTVLVNKSTELDPSLLELRNSPSVMRGILNITGIVNNTGLAFIRATAGNPGILVAANPSSDRIVVDLKETYPTVGEEVTVQYFSKNFNETGFTRNLKKSSRNIPISPKSAVVLSYVPQKEK